MVRYVCISRMAHTLGTPKSCNKEAHEAIKNFVRCIVGEPSSPSVGVSPMGGVGKARSCPPVQSPETKLQSMPIENEIVDESTDDEAI